MPTPVFDSIMLKTRIAIRDDKVMDTNAAFDLTNLNLDGAYTSVQIQQVCNDSIKDYVNLEVKDHVQRYGKFWADAFATMYPELIKQDAKALTTLDPYTASTADLVTDFGWWVDGKIDGSGNAQNYDVVFCTARQFYFARTKGNKEMSRFRAAFINRQIHVYRQVAFSGLVLTYLYVPIETDIVQGSAVDTNIPKKAIPSVVEIAVQKSNRFKKSVA